MATGDMLDIVGRLQRWLPTRWFPTDAVNPDGTVPRIYAMLAGFATVLSAAYSQMAYAKAQTRTATSTDGWLDLRAQDLFGSSPLLRLRRLPGERDPSYRARIDMALLQPANTELALSNAILALTGETPEIVEPWNPGNCGVLDGTPGAGAAYLDADCTAAPARMTDPSLRSQIFIESTLPVIAGLGGLALPALDAMSYLDTYTAPLIDLAAAESQGEAALYALIKRLKMAGIVVWAKILPHPQTPGLFWDEPGLTWDQTGNWDQEPIE